jgi:hypothetical protein
MPPMFPLDLESPRFWFGSAITAAFLAYATKTSGDVMSMAEQPAVCFDCLLRDSGLGGVYVPATQADAESSQVLFESLLRGERSEEADTELARLGFRRETLDMGGAKITAIIEAEGQRTGKGFYVIKDAAPAPSKSVPVMLQAPHRFLDHFTGFIAARLFDEGVRSGVFEAAAWNTVPRAYEVDGDRVNADLAHISTSFFNAFTRAFANVYPTSRTVQVHGYNAFRRPVGPARDAVAIVSAGVPVPTEHARDVARCLRDSLSPELVLLYPDDTRELGATTNQNAAALRELGQDGFVHLELSRGLRLRLVQDSSLRAEVTACLVGPQTLMEQ